jgi:hypothetical protein
VGKPAVLRVTITGDAKPAQRALDATATAAERTSSKWSAAGKAMATGFAAAAVVAGVKDSVRAASDLQQAVGGVQAVFGDASTAVMNFAATAANAAGLSKAQYATLATTIGSQLKNAGASAEEAAAKTQTLIGRGADMAAVFGGTAADAVAAMSSALKGEMDPIERYGVTLNAAAIKARMAADGTDKLTGAAGAQAKQAAILALMMEQTAQAQGKFAAESDTLAGQTERMNANFENAKATLGQALLPVLTDVAMALSRMATFVQANSGWLVPLVAALAAAAVTIKLVSAATSAWGAATKIVSGLTKVWTAVQAAFNIVMALNPIGLVIIAIIALIAAIVLLWRNSETFRAAVTAIWNAISAAVMAVVRAVVDFVVGAWKFMLKAISTYIGLVRLVLTTVWRAIVAVVTAYVNLVKAVITAVFRAIVTVVTTVWNTVRTVSVAGWNLIKSGVMVVVNALKTAVSTVVNGIKSTVTAVWEGLKTASTTVWEGIKNAITTPLDAIRRVVETVWNKIKAFVDFLTNLKLPSIDFPDIPGFGKSGKAAQVFTAAPAAGALAAPTPTASTVLAAAAPVVVVQVRIGDRDITDMITSVVSVAQTGLARRITSRTAVLR